MFKSIPRAAIAISKSVRDQNLLISTLKFSSAANTYETLNVTTPKEYVYHVELNRPKKMNAMSNTMWREIEECFKALDYDENCRVVVVSGAGRMFCAGIDLMGASVIGAELAEQTDVVRRAKILRKYVTFYQNSLTSLELCRKPVIAAVHNACIGGALDLICAADLRYCSQDAYFQVKEVDIGMAADVGTLQRFPKIVGSDSLVRELCYTARKLPAEEAATAGLVSKVFQDKENMLKEVLAVAELISKKSPVAIQGTKQNLVYSRDHTVQEGLDHITMWNQIALQSEDFMTATVAAATKEENVQFNKL